MDLFTVLDQSPTLNNTTYHLIQLPNDLINQLSSNTPTHSDHEKLLLKYNINRSDLYQFRSTSNSTSPFLTTPNETYKIRQQNHSNCVMLLHENTNYLNFNNYLILEKQSIQPQITVNETETPIIPVNSINDIRRFTTDLDSIHTLDSVVEIYKSFKSILSNTPVSLKDFDSYMLSHNYIPNSDSIIHVSNNLTATFIIPLLNSIKDYESIIAPQETINIVNSTYKNISQKYGIANHQLLRILTFILLKFTISKNSSEKQPIDIDQFLTYTITSTNRVLNHNSIIKFITLQILKQHKQIPLSDILIQIRLQLPPNYLPNFEINEILRGISYTTKLPPGVQVNYLPIESLVSYNSPAARFNHLFALKQQWYIEEIQPFIEDVNTRHLKTDKFCLKHCRVRKIKNKTVLTKR